MVVKMALQVIEAYKIVKVQKILLTSLGFMSKLKVIKIFDEINQIIIY